MNDIASSSVEIISSTRRSCFINSFIFNTFRSRVFFAGSIFLLLFKSFVLFEASFNPKKSRLIDCYLRICRWKHAHWKIDHWEKFSRLFLFLLSTKDIHVTFHFTGTSILPFAHKQTHTYKKWIINFNFLVICIQIFMWK